MPAFSSLSWLFHSPFWLELYGGQVRDSFTSFLLPFFLYGHDYCLSSVLLMDSCNLCHYNKLESLFECPVSRLLYDELLYRTICCQFRYGRNNARWATLPFLVCTFKPPLYYHPYVHNILVEIPANPKWDHHWLRGRPPKQSFANTFSPQCLASSCTIK